MSLNLQPLYTGYKALVQLNPRTFRTEFGADMQADFADSLAEAAQYGYPAILRICLREIRDWPTNLSVQHWSSFKDNLHQSATNKLGRIDDTPGVVPINAGSSLHLVTYLTSKNPLIRRIVDLMVATFGLVLLAPLVLLLPIWIKLDTPGPVFFTHQKVGRNGKLFTMYKFRSMRQEGQIRPISRSGRFMRRYNFDEMPQIINLFKGDMSVIGRRPESKGCSKTSEREQGTHPE